MPKVFYGSRTRSVTPPSAHASDESGSEASTDIEVSRRRPVHRRGESVDASQPESKRARTRTARDAQGRRPLQKACQRNDVDRVRTILAQHVDIEDRDYAGTSALHDAALNGNAEIVRLLLENGAVVDVRSGLEELDTPLMDAVAAGSVEVTKLLVDAGADPRISNAVGKAAVDFLDEDDESAGQIVQIIEDATRALRTSGAHIVDSPSHPDAPPNLFPPGYEARKRVVSTNFIDVTRRTGRGIRADAVAHAAEGNLAFVGLALERGWNPSPEALVKAAKFGHQEVVGLLLAFGLDADALFEGQTALKAAVQRGHVSTAQLLIQSGSNLAWKDSRGRSYSDLVADLPVTDPMRMLIEGTPGASVEKGSGEPKISIPPATVDRAPNSHHDTPSSKLSELSHNKADPRDNVDSATPSEVKSVSQESSGAKSVHERPVSMDLSHKKVRAGTVPESIVSAEQRNALSETAIVKHENDKRMRSSSDDLRHRPDRSTSNSVNSRHVSDGHALATLASSSNASSSNAFSHREHSGNPSSANVVSTDDSSSNVSSSSVPKDRVSTALRTGDASSAAQRVSVRSDSRPEAFRLADLRAIKPKKRSKSVPEPDQTENEKDEAPQVSVVTSAAAPTSSPASVSPDPGRDSPALSPLTEGPAEKVKFPAEDSPKWIERSNELAELARRREKQRLAREARMLESLADEERRRSQEPHSPVAQSPLSEPSSDQQLEPSSSASQSAPVVLTESRSETATPGIGESETVATDPPSASVKHLPYFLRQLSYKDESLDVGPLFVHFIDKTPYYLDVQVAALAGIPQLHARYPQWLKVPVTDTHKLHLWSLSRPWAVGRGASSSILAAEEAAFVSLNLAWIPKAAVDETLFQGASPSTVNIRLDPPKLTSKWSTLLSDSELPLRLQFRSALLRRVPDW